MLRRSTPAFTNLNEVAEGKQPKVDTIRIRSLVKKTRNGDFGVFDSGQVKEFAKNQQNVDALASVIDQKNQQEERVEEAKLTGKLPF